MIKTQNSSNFIVHKKLLSIDFNVMAQQLRQFRIRSGLSQKDIADILKLTPTYISNIENGKTKLNLFMLIAYSRICDFSIDSLVSSILTPHSNSTPDTLDYTIYVKSKNLTSEQKKKLIKIIDIL